MIFEPIQKKAPCFPDGGALSVRIGGGILLDCGSFISSVPREEQVKITDIFLTHAHLDHIKDLAFLGESLFDVFTQTIRVHGTARTIELIKKHIFNGSIWPDFTKLPVENKPVFRFQELTPLKGISVDGHLITAVPVNHCEGAVGYIISKENQHVVMTGDTGPTDKIWELADKLDGDLTVFIETSFPDRLEKVAKSAMHLTPEYLSQELKKIKKKDAKIYVYHIKTPYLQEISIQILQIKDSRVEIL